MARLQGRPFIMTIHLSRPLHPAYAMIRSMLLIGGVTLSVQAFARIPLPVRPVFKKDTVNIVKFAAVPDGATLNTRSIQSAIDAIHRKGGGVVLIPRGLWVTGPIVLKSKVNLHLADGALLQFTDDHSQYPLVEGNWEGLPQMRNQSPISASQATDIAITGKGIIDGNGDGWRMVKKEKLTESNWKKLVASGGFLGDNGRSWYPSQTSFNGSKYTNPGVISPEKDAAFYASVKDYLRPNLLVLDKCKRILLEGVTFQNSAAWCLHPLMSEDITVRDIFVKNPWYAQNGDGIDLESCRNVLIERSIFDVGDDALCMKSGRDAAGRKRGMPVENVTIRDCTVYASHGGFVIGSEMSGGARNIDVRNCSFIGTDIGLRFKTTRGRGGVVENINIRDIHMINIPGEAILFDMYYAAKDPIALVGEKREAPRVEFKPVDETTPVFRKFNISNVQVNGAAKGIFLRGLPEMSVKDIVLENMYIRSDIAVELQDAEGITLKNITLAPKQADPVVQITNSKNISFEDIRFPKASPVLFRLSGDRVGDIRVTGSDAAGASNRVVAEFGASTGVLQWK